MDKKLKDLKDEVLVVTNAAEGNTPHVVEDIEPEGGTQDQTVGRGKAFESVHADRPQRVYTRNVLPQHETTVRAAVRLPLLSPSGGLACLRQGACRPVQAARK